MTIATREKLEPIGMMDYCHKKTYERLLPKEANEWLLPKETNERHGTTRYTYERLKIWETNVKLLLWD